MKSVKFLALSVICIALATCTKKQGSVDQSTAKAEKVTISYGIWDDTLKPFLTEIIAAYEGKNPNVQIDLQVVPWSSYWQKLQIAFSGGQAWDVFWINAPYFLQYNSYGVMADLSDTYTKNGIDPAQFPKDLVNMYQVDDKSFVLPWFFDTIVLYYNKKRFEEAGIARPNADWTLEDVRNAAEQLNEGENRWATASYYNSQQLWGLMLANGGKVFSDDGMEIAYDLPESKEILKFYYQLAADGLSPKVSTLTALGGTAPRTLLANGNIAMYNDGSWAYGPLYKDMGDNLGLIPLPAPSPRKERGTILHGLATVPSAKSENIEIAKDFASFMVSPTAQNIIAKAHSVMPTFQAALDLWQKNADIPEDAAILSDVSKAFPYQVSQTGGLDWDSRVIAIMNDVFDGNKPFDEGLKQAITEANSIIAEQ